MCKVKRGTNSLGRSLEARRGLAANRRGCGYKVPSVFPQGVEYVSHCKQQPIQQSLSHSSKVSKTTMKWLTFSVAAAFVASSTAFPQLAVRQAWTPQEWIAPGPNDCRLCAHREPYLDSDGSWL